MLRSLLTLCILIATLCVHAAVADIVLRQVHVVHRHGARTPIVSYNKSSLCGTLGCGQLNAEGKDMLVHLGAWMRSQPEYRRLLEGRGDAGGGISSPAYDPLVVRSRSTDVDRTLQSSDGFLRGAFPDFADFYPAIFTRSELEDVALREYAQMAYQLLADANMIAHYGIPIVDSFSADDLEVLAVEASVPAYCDGPIANLRANPTARNAAAKKARTGDSSSGSSSEVPSPHNHNGPWDDPTGSPRHDHRGGAATNQHTVNSTPPALPPTYNGATTVEGRRVFRELVTCLSKIHDVAASKRSTMEIANFNQTYPTLASFYGTLCKFVAQRHDAEFGYHPEQSSADLQRGSLGHFAAKDIVEFMAGKATAHPRFKTNRRGVNPERTAVFEWSAHDSTLAVFSSAVASTTDMDYMLPLFGQAFILELWENTAYVPTPRDEGQAIDGGWTVKLRYCAPGQLVGDHNVTIETKPIACLMTDVTPTVGSTAWSQAVTLTTSGCKLMDFWRYVNSTAPQSWKGFCYVSAEVLSAIECDTAAPASTKLCKRYREKCPFFSCPDGYLLQHSDLSCVPASRKQEVSAGAIVVIILAALAVGVVAGVVVSAVLALLVARRRHMYGSSGEFGQGLVSSEMASNGDDYM